MWGRKKVKNELKTVLIDKVIFKHMDANEVAEVDISGELLNDLLKDILFESSGHERNFVAYRLAGMIAKLKCVKWRENDNLPNTLKEAENARETLDRVKLLNDKDINRRTNETKTH